MFIMIGGDTCPLSHLYDDTETKASVFLTGVALKIRGDIFYQLRPARHANLIRTLGKIGMDLSDVLGATQGFLTNRGDFVTRIEALAIATNAKQIFGPIDPGRGISSNNVW